MLVLGGTDGEIMQNGLWKIDFAKKEAEIINDEFDINTAFNKMFVIDGTLHVFGGHATEGVDYTMNLNASEK